MIHFIKVHVSRWPTLPPGLTSLVAGAALIAAFLAGADYIAAPPDKARLLSSVEAAIPLDIWGIYMVTAVCLAIYRWASDRWWVTDLGHSALVGIYLAFGIGVFLSLADDWQWYGWRPGVNRLAMAIIHYALARAAWLRWDVVREERNQGQSL